MNENIKQSDSSINIIRYVEEITDFLQPLLSPYESVIYWFMFRHSFVLTGKNLTRISISKLAKGIGSKFKKNNAPVLASDKAIGDNLRALEVKGVIKKVGDTTRLGTLYRVFLPEEIEICKRNIEDFLNEQTPIINPKNEQDYYNIKENRLKIFERDKYLCYKCDKQLTIYNATIDHINPVSEGGNNSFDNLITCCFHCNSRRRSTPISDFIVE